MATYQTICPIIKSANDFGYNVPIGYNTQGLIYLSPTATGIYLSVAYRGTNGPKTRIGIAWDDSNIPKNKKIIRAELVYYGTRGHGDNVYYRYADFAEGSAIPTHEPADGSVFSGANTGWQVLDLGEPKGNSVILFAELGKYSAPVYDQYGNILFYDSNMNRSWQFYSQRYPNSAYHPYVRITYSDIPPGPPTGLYPNGGTISTRDGIRFSWSHNSKEGLPQKAFVLQYSFNGGSTWTTIQQTSSDQYYEIGPNVFPESGIVTWRVKTIDTNDTESEFSAASFTLGILPQKAPIPVSPVSQYVMEGNPVRFEWVFTGGSEKDYQAKFVLQYSADGGNTWTTVEQTSSNTNYMVPAGTFLKGNVSWRVKTYNQWGDESPYSDTKMFTVIGVPAVPLITEITNKSRPTIKWQTQEQQLFELEIIKDGDIIYSTGVMPDSTREYSVPVYLDNGEYIVRLRVVNEYSLFSDWAEKRFAISVDKPDKPGITIYNGFYKVTIKTDSTLKAMVYRDNEEIGIMVNGIFEDYTGANEDEYKYFVRVIDENDSFADSDIKLGKCRLPANTIATLDNPAEFIKLEYGLDGIPEKRFSLNIDATTRHFDGRKLPVIEYSEFENESKSMSFFFEKKDDVLKFKELISQRKPFIYRDIDGEIIIGFIAALDIEKTILGYNVGFTITRCVP